MRECIPSLKLPFQLVLIIVLEILNAQLDIELLFLIFFALLNCLRVVLLRIRQIIKVFMFFFDFVFCVLLFASIFIVLNLVVDDVGNVMFFLGSLDFLLACFDLSFNYFYFV